MTVRTCIAILAVLIFGAQALASPLAAFEIAGSRATAGLVLAPWADEPAEIPEAPMLRTLLGVAGTLNARQVRDLERAVARETRVPPDSKVVEPLYRIMLSRPGSEPRELQLGRVREGWLMLEAGGLRFRLEQSVFDRVAESWLPSRPDPLLQGQYQEGGGEVPPRVSRIRLDRQTLAARFARGGRVPFAQPLTREIESERFRLFVPEGIERQRPGGLIVWIDPLESPEFPPALIEAAEETGWSVILPKDAGNGRPIVDRLQVALDAVATAGSVLWLDQDRICIAGLSGGGRLASMLWACAPDVFSSALCIAGLNSHHDVPAQGGKVLPASHLLPSGDARRTLGDHPIAAISGPRDFNFREVHDRTRRLKQEGFTARLFDLPELGHEMPEAPDIARALTWLDSSVIQKRDDADRRVSRLFERIPVEILENPEAVLSERDRAVLERIATIAPWTKSAWRAAVRLGYASPVTLTPSDGP